MKKAFLFIALVWMARAGLANVIPGDDTALVLFASSYDTQPYHYFGDYVGSWVALGNPEYTSHWASASRAGAGLQEANENRLERLGLGHWASATHAIGIIMADDNGGYTSNQVRMHLSNTFAAPGLFFNGTDYVDEGGWAASHSITWIGVGAIPHDSDGGDGGEADRNGAIVRMCSDSGLLGIDMWNPMWAGGWGADHTNGTQLLGFYSGSHPFASGSLTMGILIAQALAGADTNVSASVVDWTSATFTYTNHCVLTSVSRAGNVLTFTRHDDRLPMGWDVPDGTITNDCRNAFVGMPALADAFRFMVGLTNMPVGTYDVTIGGVFVITLTSADFETHGGLGWNMFTNMSLGPYATKRKAVLGLIRDKNGADRITLLDHNAGDAGANGRDLVHYGSDSQGSWNSGNRGDALVTALASDLTSLDSNYDAPIHDEAQTEDVVFSITLKTGPKHPQDSAMKLLALIFICLLAGCAVPVPPAAKPVAESAAPVPVVVQGPPMPAALDRVVPASEAEPIAAVQPRAMNFSFVYPQPLTDGYLQSSTDLVHWETRTDYTIQTNIVDGTNRLQWLLPRDPAKPCEYYRGGGETIL